MISKPQRAGNHKIYTNQKLITGGHVLGGHQVSKKSFGDLVCQDMGRYSEAGASNIRDFCKLYQLGSVRTRTACGALSPGFPASSTSSWLFPFHHCFFFLSFCVPLIIFSVHLLSVYIAFLKLPVLFFSYTLDISV